MGVWGSNRVQALKKKDEPFPALPTSLKPKKDGSTENNYSQNDQTKLRLDSSNDESLRPGISETSTRDPGIIGTPKRGTKTSNESHIGIIGKKLLLPEVKHAESRIGTKILLPEV